MKFEEIFPALRNGKYIKRDFWPDESTISITDWKCTELDGDDILSDDWQIIEAPKKIDYINNMEDK